MTSRKLNTLVAHNKAAELINTLSVDIQNAVWREWGGKVIKNCDGNLKKKFKDFLNGLISNRKASNGLVWFNHSDYNFSVSVRAYCNDGAAELCNYLFKLTNGVLTEKEVLPARRCNWTEQEVEEIQNKISRLERELSDERSKLPF